MCLRLALASLALVTFCGCAHATTIDVFDVSTSTSSGTALDGSVGGTNQSVSNVSGVPVNSAAAAGYGIDDHAGTSAASLFIDLSLPLAPLVDYIAGTLCSTARTCADRVNSEVFSSSADYNQAKAGTLELMQNVAAPTPEPPALLLLGTGVLALGILLRKRYV